MAARLGVTPDHAEDMSRAVFAALRELPSASREVDHVETQLPSELLWRSRLRASRASLGELLAGVSAACTERHCFSPRPASIAE